MLSSVSDVGLYGHSMSPQFTTKSSGFGADVESFTIKANEACLMGSWCTRWLEKGEPTLPGLSDYMAQVPSDVRMPRITRQLTVPIMQFRRL